MGKTRIISRRTFVKSLAAVSALPVIGGSIFRLRLEEAPGSRVDSSRTSAQIPTVCLMCPVRCGLVARCFDGRLITIEGNPNHPLNRGGLCPKGEAGIMTLYDPYRVKAPLIRTNPQKGEGIDPKWKEINWDEALNIVARKLRDIRSTDPREFTWLHGIDDSGPIESAFVSALGSPNLIGLDSIDEASAQVGDEVTLGTSLHRTDVDFCDYLILFGSNPIESGTTLSLWYAQHIAEAKTRGMKLIVIDPRFTNSAAMADEWIPIMPSTDAALALGMMNFLIEEKLIDEWFIKNVTNGPYLVGQDGYFLKKDGKPLVWDMTTSSAVTFDTPATDPAITATFTVGGIRCKPAFQELIDTVMNYTPEKVSEITGVTADTIKRIAREFGQAAKIGSTIMINGKVLPYRPAAAEFSHGVCAHEQGTLNSRAMLILNMLTGNIDAVGGIALMKAGEGDMTGVLRPKAYKVTFPPERIDLQQSYYPLANHGILQQVALSILNPEKYKLPYSIEMAVLYNINPPLQSPNEREQVEAYGKIPFLVVIDANMTEAAELADIVLPACTYLETLELVSVETPNDAGDALRQPVVKPMYESRNVVDILTDIAERSGFLDGVGGFNDNINTQLDLKDQHKLELKRKYANEEIIDKWCKSRYGFDYGLEWFRRNGVKTTRLTPQKKYQRYTIEGRTYRLHLYSEFLKEVGEELKRKAETFDVTSWDGYRNYRPLPEYVKPTGHDVPAQYDLSLTTFTPVEHMWSLTVQNAWLMELYGSGASGLDEQYLWMNPEDAKTRGIQNGDSVFVESVVDRFNVKAKLVESIRPGVVALSKHFGHWASSRIGKKGVNVNRVIPAGEGYLDTISGMQSLNDVKVKVYRG